MKKINKTNKLSKSASELISEMEQDNQYVTRLHQNQREQKESIDNYRSAAAPILNNLDKIGIQVNFIGELLQNKANHKAAIPILLEWLGGDC